MAPATDLWRLGLCAWVILALASPCGAGEVAARELPRSTEWEGLQFLGSDTKGRVYVLDGERLEVHRLTREGLGKAIELEGSAGFEQGGAVMAAAMGDTPGDWLLRTGAFEVRLFRGREQKPIPESPWLVQDVLMADGSPVVAVAPMGRGVGIDSDQEAPELLSLLGQTWTPLLAAEPAEDPRLVSSDMQVRQDAIRHLRWRLTRVLAAEPNGRVWVADRHAFRARELRESGNLRSVLTLGPDPQMEIVERPVEEREEIIKEMAKAGRKVAPDASWLMEQPTMSILGMTVARDGRLYLASPGEEGLLLARWDSLRLAFEQVRLSGVEGVTNSILDLAAGRDGLFVAERAGYGGRWYVPWEALEAAEWEEPEETVYLDGVPLVEVLPPDPTGATEE